MNMLKIKTYCWHISAQKMKLTMNYNIRYDDMWRNSSLISLCLSQTIVQYTLCRCIWKVSSQVESYRWGPRLGGARCAHPNDDGTQHTLTHTPSRTHTHTFKHTLSHTQIQTHGISLTHTLTHSNTHYSLTAVSLTLPNTNC